MVDYGLKGDFFLKKGSAASQAGVQVKNRLVGGRKRIRGGRCKKIHTEPPVSCAEANTPDHKYRAYEPWGAVSIIDATCYGECELDNELNGTKMSGRVEWRTQELIGQVQDVPFFKARKPHQKGATGDFGGGTPNNHPGWLDPDTPDMEPLCEVLVTGMVRTGPATAGTMGSTTSFDTPITGILEVNTGSPSPTSQGVWDLPSWTQVNPTELCRSIVGPNKIKRYQRYYKSRIVNFIKIRPQHQMARDDEVDRFCNHISTTPEDVWAELRGRSADWVDMDDNDSVAAYNRRLGEYLETSDDSDCEVDENLFNPDICVYGRLEEYEDDQLEELAESKPQDQPFLKSLLDRNTNGVDSLVEYDTDNHLFESTTFGYAGPLAHLIRSEYGLFDEGTPTNIDNISYLHDDTLDSDFIKMWDDEYVNMAVNYLDFPRIKELPLELQEQLRLHELRRLYLHRILYMLDLDLYNPQSIIYIPAGERGPELKSLQLNDGSDGRGRQKGTPKLQPEVRTLFEYINNRRKVWSLLSDSSEEKIKTSTRAGVIYYQWLKKKNKAQARKKERLRERKRIARGQMQAREFTQMTRIADCFYRYVTKSLKMALASRKAPLGLIPTSDEASSVPNWVPPQSLEQIKELPTLKQALLLREVVKLRAKPPKPTPTANTSVVDIWDFVNPDIEDGTFCDMSVDLHAVIYMNWGALFVSNYDMEPPYCKMFALREADFSTLHEVVMQLDDEEGSVNSKLGPMLDKVRQRSGAGGRGTRVAPIPTTADLNPPELDMDEILEYRVINHTPQIPHTTNVRGIGIGPLGNL